MKTRKDNHVGLRLEDEDLTNLDCLCESVGSASRSRVLRRLLLYVASDVENGVETNHRRTAFVRWFRRLDDAIIEEAVEGIADGVRSR